MKHKRTIIGLNLSVFLMMLGVGMIVAVLPQRILDLTGDSSKVGFLASAFALSYIALQVPMGNLSDKYGFKMFLIMGYILCSVTGVIYYFSNNANMIFFGRMVQGLGEAPIWALAPALLAILYPLNKARAMGIYNASLHLGLTLGPIMGAILEQYLKGNQFFLFYAAVCFISALVVHFTVDNIKAEVDKPSIHMKSLLGLMKDKEIALVFSGIALYGVGYGMFLTNVPAFLINVKNFDQYSVRIYFSLFYIAISISQIITGTLSDKFGRKIFMISGLSLTALGIFLFSQFDGLLLNVVLTFASLGLGVFYLSSMAFLNDIVPDHLRGTISGAYFLFWGIGYFFGPIIIGQLGNIYGNNKGFYLFSAALIMEALFITIRFMNTKAKRTDIAR